MDLPTTHNDKSATTEKVESGGLLKKISFFIFLVAIFLSPLIFIPSAYAPLDVVKAVFISTCVLVAAILSTISALRKPVITLPRFALGYSALAVIVSLLLSTLMSSNVSKSFIGQGFELGTASFILLMFVAAYFVARTAARDSETVFKMYSAFFISIAILIVFHLIRIFGGAGVLNFGILQNVTTTVAGKWYDFALLTGAAAILSLVGVKFLPLRQGLKRTLFGAFVVCMIVLFFVNATFIWGIFAVLMIALGAYEYSLKGPKGSGFKGFSSRVSLLTFVVLVLSLIFAVKGDALVTPIMAKFNTGYAEAALPWQLTLDVTSGTLKSAPIFGAGPNRFGYQYLLNKPLSVNITPFWNTEFPTGFALLPTFVATQGILGALLWILFFVFFIREGVRAFRKTNEPLARFLLTSSFFTSAFLWVASFIYVPSHATVFATFVFTGIYIASLIHANVIKEKEIVVRPGARYGRVALIAVSICTILLVIWLGAYAKKTIALTYFQKGIKALNVTKAPEIAEKDFKKALVWDDSDIYYQALSEINILKINNLMAALQNETASGATPDQAKVEQVVNLITESLKYSKAAQKIDPNNYYNYIAEARISEIGTSLKLPNAYENARIAYASALKINPANPSIYLSAARLEASQNKLTDAEQAIGQALRLKPNYTEAVFYLSQLQVAENKISDAITSTVVAIRLNPEEPLLYFQLGLLQYNNKDYTSAIQAFEKAKSLNTEYANARYFLGLAYARMGNNEKAIEEFDYLAKTNPDNKEVAFILSNLKEGRSPFADAKPPIDSKPEKRKTLPVAEKPETTKEKPTATTTKRSS